MPVAVSVVVPFFNSRVNLDECVVSLLDQTLDRERFEILLMDDGSTDGSSERADRWAAQHPDLITVHHLEASGGPAHPRNVGIERAVGRYVQFLDSDDTLGPEALARVAEVATQSGAQIAFGKVSSDFRSVYHPIFRKTLTGLNLESYPLIQNLHISKMFRREFLLDNDIRFHEGTRYVTEDQEFCVLAFAHARSVAIVGDTPYYFYRRRRTSGLGFGDTPIDPRLYFAHVGEVLDTLDIVPEESARFAASGRFYRGEVLGRLRGRAMLAYAPDYRQAMVDAAHTLATTRFTADHRADLPVFARAQSAMLLDRDVDRLMAYARWLESLRLQAEVSAPAWHDGKLAIEIDAELTAGDQPFRFERADDRWLIPADVAPGVTVADREVTARDLDAADLDCATVSRADALLWSTTEGLGLTIEPDGRMTVRGRVMIDPGTAAGGRPLSAGLWDLRLRVMVGGLTRTSPLRPSGEAEPLPAWVGPSAAVMAYWTAGTPTLALDVAEWSHPLHDLVEPAPDLHRRGRRLKLSVPAISGDRSKRTAQLILEPDQDKAAVRVCPAELSVTKTGSTVRAKLPGRRGPQARWSVWLRIGEPGTAPARPLDLEVSRERGRFRVGPAQT